MMLKDFRKLPVDEVWTNGSDVIVLGSPPGNNEEGSVHNCDGMGCGYCHVLLRGSIESIGFDFGALDPSPEKP